MKTSNGFLTAFLSEYAGTFLLLLNGGTAITVFLGYPEFIAIAPNLQFRIFLIALTFGFTVFLLIQSPVGRLTGAHLNPAVSLAFWLDGHLSSQMLSVYMTAQFLGSGLAVFLIYQIFGDLYSSVNFALTEPGANVHPIMSLMIEALLTFGLITVIFYCLTHEKYLRFCPHAVFIYLVVAIMIGAPLSGASLNPARSLGPAIIAQKFSALWIYFVGPALGAILARLACVTLPFFKRPKFFKLGHQLPKL